MISDILFSPQPNFDRWLATARRAAVAGMTRDAIMADCVCGCARSAVDAARGGAGGGGGNGMSHRRGRLAAGSELATPYRRDRQTVARNVPLNP